MKNLKKNIIIFGAVAIALLMVSSATAVGQVNSEPLMNYIEREEQTDYIDQLEETIASGYPAYMGGEYTVDDFVDYILSDEFIDFMKSQKITDLLNSDTLLEIYNTDEVQEYIQSKEFRDFRVSKVACTFLEKYRAKTGQTLTESTYVDNQCVYSESQSVNLATIMNTNMQTTTQVNTNEETSSSETTYVVNDENEESMSTTMSNTEPLPDPPGGSVNWILLLFTYLVVGIITWPVALGVFGLGAPAWGAFAGFVFFALAIETGTPLWLAIVAAAVIALVTTLDSIILAIGWPILYALILE